EVGDNPCSRRVLKKALHELHSVCSRFWGGCQRDIGARLANLAAVHSGSNPNSFLFIESRQQRPSMAILEPYTLGPSGVLRLPLESRGLQVRDKRSDSFATIR